MRLLRQAVFRRRALLQRTLPEAGGSGGTARLQDPDPFLDLHSGGGGAGADGRGASGGSEARSRIFPAGAGGVGLRAGSGGVPERAAQPQCRGADLRRRAVHAGDLMHDPLALIFLFKEVGEDPGPVFPGAEACNLAGQVAVQDVFRLGLQEDGDAQELILDPAAAEKPLF